MEEKLSEKAKILSRLKKKRVGENVVTDKPAISIIIPAYNLSEVITEALDSVFSQTFQDFELILVNDGSPDSEKLEEALQPYLEKIVFCEQKNLGASLARNAAIALSRGDLIAFLDGDDMWFPKFLESQIKEMEQKKLDMIYCDAELFGDNFTSFDTYMQSSPSNGPVNPTSLISAKCNVITSGTVLKRKILEESRLFDRNVKYAQDFDLWFRLSKLGAKIGYQRRVLLKYRVSVSGLSGSNIERAERNVDILNVIKKKYSLSEEETDVWDKRMALSLAEVDLETAKFSLIEKNYEKAAAHLEQANQYYKKPRLAIVKWMLRTFPDLALKLFEKLRPNEFAFISRKNSGQ